MLKQALILVIAIISIGAVASEIDLNKLFGYESQEIPTYIRKDNTLANSISDESATLGRVLFYDPKLSVDNSVSCSSCHQQEFAFGDTSVVSKGVNGLTGRHSMRLVNSRFGDEGKFFWDERASSLEQQTTMPIQDHLEMGYSGQNGDPTIDFLIEKLENVDYYEKLFTLAFGDDEINEDRIQLALAQFVRSLQSFDSKFDQGFVNAVNLGRDFNNFTEDENAGKRLFLQPGVFGQNSERVTGGLGCQGCHAGPEFDIDPNSRSNGVVGVLDNGVLGTDIDLTVTRAPSLRDIFNPNGQLNGQMMHTGQFSTIDQVIDHYNEIVLPDGVMPNRIDPRLRPAGMQNLRTLDVTADERRQLTAFLKTLTGTDIYVNPAYSDPFESNGKLNLIDIINSTEDNSSQASLKVYPNPASNTISLENYSSGDGVDIYDINGVKVMPLSGSLYTGSIDVSSLSSGHYFLVVRRNHDSRGDGIKIKTLSFEKR